LLISGRWLEGSWLLISGRLISWLLLFSRRHLLRLSIERNELECACSVNSEFKDCFIELVLWNCKLGWSCGDYE
jgi:hypothetical protein